MNTVIRSKVVKIGNSRGVRIPHLLIEQAGLTDEVEMHVKGNQLIIQSSRRPRQEWEGRFAEMSQQGDDRLLDEPTHSHWDKDEWTW